MGIRKPNLSVKEARDLASVRSAAAAQALAPDPKAAPRLSDATAVPAAKSRPEATVEATAKGNGSAPSPGTGSISRAPQQKPSEMRPPARPSTRMHDAVTLRGTVTGDMATTGPIPAALAPRGQDKVQVFLSAPIPAAGVSPIFDALARQYGPQKALQMILRKALHIYEKLLRSNAFQGGPETYSSDASVSADVFVQTSRMMPKAVVATARAHFDPFGFESTRAFGRKLATAALATFFASERSVGS